MGIFLSILLAGVTVLAISLKRAYTFVPLRELKHRARSGNKLAAAMLQAAGYGYSLQAVLWLLIGLSAAGFIVVVALHTTFWTALLLGGLLLWVSFGWVPAVRVSSVGEHLAAWVAPVLTKLLSLLHPIIDKTVRLVQRYRPVTLHTGLYDRRDLIDLLERQQVQADNRIEKAELEIARHALSFGDDSVSQHMIPRRHVQAVSADDVLGPVLMDELHASGHSRFPVYDGRKDNIVGTLYLRHLVNAKHGGTVSLLMKKHVSFVHEDQSLHDALQAVLKTHHQLFIVVNSLEEYVGVITIEDILEAILGNPVIDEFDEYGDLRAVAARATKKEHIQYAEEVIEPETSPQADEATQSNDLS